MDASLKVNCACTRETALGCRPLLRIRALAALVRPEHRWHDEEEAEAANRWHDGERTTVIPAKAGIHYAVE